MDTDGGPLASPQVNAEIYARTTQDGSIFDGATDTLNGDPAFLNAGMAEVDRQVDTSTADSGNLASFQGDEDESTLVGPDGTAYDFRTVIGAKTGNLPAGNGLWGDGNRCGFGISRFGTS